MPLWKQLSAVRAGRVHRISSSGWTYDGPGAAAAALDDLERLLA